MNHYLEARQWLRNGVSIQEFRDRLPPSLTDKGFLSLLLGAAIQQGLEPLEDYLQLLIGQGADLNYCQYQSKPAHNGVKMSLFMFACKKSSLSTVQTFLAQSQLQVYHRDTNGRNAIHYAIQNGDESEGVGIIKALFEEFPNLKEMGNYPKGNYLTLAIRESKPLILQLLISEEINPNFKSLEGLGPLHEAVRAHKGHRNKEVTLQILNILLAAGVQQEELNNDGQTYLNYAREKGFLQQTDIQDILESILNSTTPKATIQTSPQEKIFSIESQREEKHESQLNSDSQSSENQETQTDHYKISSQMYQEAKKVQEEHARIWQLVFPFYRQIEALVHQFSGSIEVIGSFASQLWIPSSDIDILLTIPDGGNSTLFQEITENLFVRISQQCSYNKIKLIRSYKLPLIKLILNEEFQYLQIELFLSNKKNIASKYVMFTNEIISYFPEIAVIYYVLRRLLAFKKLHDHRTGGLKAYALFLLIYSMRNLYHYPYVSQFVEHFCFYYGFVFEYQTQINSEGQIEYHMNIVDPLNSDNNMGGKRTDILGLQDTLKKIYYCLNTPNEGKKMDYIKDVLKYL